MTDNAARSPRAANPSLPDDPIERSRMSFGDHLEELRSCLIKALIGVAIGTVLSLVFGKEILGILCRPLLLAQHRQGLPPNLQVLSPTGAFTVFLKIGFLSGLIVSMPWVLHQIWRFVAAGLYPHERRFVRFLLPSSLGLFAVGVLFLYTVVLPIVLFFFIRFNESFGPPPLGPAALRNPVSGQAASKPPENAREQASIPILPDDPEQPRPGDVWFNTTVRRLVVRTESETWSAPLEKGATPTMMRSQFAIDFYVTFVLILALAFGIAFETPIVVFFLAWTGIVRTATMARGRRYVLMVILVLAAILTPPDVVSQLMLAAPMYLLFELGILVARTTERRRNERA